MRKVGTVAAKSSKKIWQQKLTIGLDLGDRNSWYCVLDEAGQIQVEQRVRRHAKALGGEKPCLTETNLLDPDRLSHGRP